MKKLPRLELVRDFGEIDQGPNFHDLWEIALIHADRFGIGATRHVLENFGATKVRLLAAQHYRAFLKALSQELLSR